MSDWKKMVCDYKACGKIATTEWRVVGGVSSHPNPVDEAVYCDGHSKTHAEPSKAHSLIGEIERGGSDD